MTGDVVINVIVAFIVSTPEINIVFTAWALTLAAVMLWYAVTSAITTSDANAIGIIKNYLKAFYPAAQVDGATNQQLAEFFMTRLRVHIVNQANSYTLNAAIDAARQAAEAGHTDDEW